MREMVLPSKELLCELGFNVGYDSILNYNDTYLFIIDDGINVVCSVNIYELMHMMKVWAYDNYKISVISYKHSFWVAKLIQQPSGEAVIFTMFTSEESEFEAVTKACNWILEHQTWKY